MKHLPPINPNKIFSVLEGKFFNRMNLGACLVVSENLTVLETMAAQLDGLACDVFSCSHATFYKGQGDCLPDNCSVVFYDICNCKDLDRAIDSLVSLRTSIKSCPVVLLPCSKWQNDFDKHRTAISDVALAIPCKREEFIWGLRLAFENYTSSEVGMRRTS